MKKKVALLLALCLTLCLFTACAGKDGGSKTPASAAQPVEPGPPIHSAALIPSSSRKPSSMALEALMTTMTLSNSVVTRSIMASSRVVGSR